MSSLRSAFRCRDAGVQLRIDSLDHLASQFQNEPKHTVSGWMLGAEIDRKVSLGHDALPNRELQSMKAAAPRTQEKGGSAGREATRNMQFVRFWLTDVCSLADSESKKHLTL